MPSAPISQAAQVTYNLAFNLPRGKVSFHAFAGNPKVNHDLGIKYRLCTRGSSETDLLFFNENKEPLAYEELSALISKKKAKRVYMIGDVFVVEIYDKNGQLLFKQQSPDTSTEWPPDAIDETIVYANYHK